MLDRSGHECYILWNCLLEYMMDDYTGFLLEFAGLLELDPQAFGEVGTSIFAACTSTS